MMTREEYRGTKHARHLLRLAINAAFAPLVAELDAALEKVREMHAAYLKEHAPGGLCMVEPGSHDHQDHLRVLQVCRSLQDAERPILDAKQAISMAPIGLETEEWETRLGNLYGPISLAESALAQVNAIVRLTGRPLTMAAFQGKSHGDRLRAIGKATLKPTAECDQAQIDLLCGAIGL